ncbi:cytoplasmic chaperone TorD family protein [Candidatus Thiomargarita nelsonii]|uniref:Cytoplasmic chaperone TorD family protein n=1 Tax=Candidatus Thiomargarita nelsonii TaxID=1003181 RepID=A0A176S0H6_9GAMM|nr:cytoplasmic chaperone TorD family protein [Candidatus Thiomargarita nelsonii]
MLSENITPQKLRLLAGLLAKPGEDSLAALEEIAKENHWLYESVQQLKDISLEHWQGEHTQLFINGHPETTCPPFESVYRHSVMNGPVCNKIEQIYQSIGLEPVDDMLPDYLGVMLECAAYLLEQKLPTEHPQEDVGDLVHIEETGKYFQTLWQDHLAKWVPKFANDLQKHSELRLYQQLGLKLKELF